MAITVKESYAKLMRMTKSQLLDMAQGLGIENGAQFDKTDLAAFIYNFAQGISDDMSNPEANLELAQSLGISTEGLSEEDVEIALNITAPGTVLPDDNKAHCKDMKAVRGKIRRAVQDAIVSKTGTTHCILITNDAIVNVSIATESQGTELLIAFGVDDNWVSPDQFTLYAHVKAILFPDIATL